MKNTRPSYQSGWIEARRRGGRKKVFVLRCWFRDPESETGWTKKSKTVARCKNGKQAKVELNKWMQELGINEANNADFPTEITFREFVGSVWENYMDNQNVKLSTRNSWKSLLNKHLLPKFGDCKMRDFTCIDLVWFFSELRDRGYSRQYRRHFYVFLKLIFDVAVESNLINSTPVSARLHRPKLEYQESHEKPILSVDQIREVLAQIPIYWRPLFFCAAVTALRSGELLALRWTDVKWLRMELHVTHSLWKGELTTPKTKSSVRTIHMPEELVQTLQNWKQMSSFTEPGDFIFCRPDGGPANPDYLRKRVLYPALDAAGVKRGKRTHGFHLFRHSAGSIVHDQTGSLKKAQTLLGHARIDTTANTYVHLGKQGAKDGLEILAREISSCPLFAHYPDAEAEIVN